MRKKQNRKSRAGWIVALAILACAAVLTGIMAVNAVTLHLMRATVYLEDLPPAFEGRTILFASDIDLRTKNDAWRAAEVFDRLQVLTPDLLILGGDYAAPGILDLLNRTPVSQYAANTSDFRRDFFYYIKDFPATLGKVMIASPDDLAAGDLRAIAAGNGFTLLDGGGVELKLGGDSVWVVGLAPDTLNASDMSHRFGQHDCVIALAHSPTQFPALMTAEARDGGHWIDLALAGHTHGGQIRLFGRSILTLDAREQQFLHGWNRETGVPMLTTSGMGCEGADLRLASQAEVWLITLTGQENNVSRET